jgi:hypothetical protein
MSKRILPIKGKKDKLSFTNKKIDSKDDLRQRFFPLLFCLSRLEKGNISPNFGGFCRGEYKIRPYLTPVNHD